MEEIKYNFTPEEASEIERALAELKLTPLFRPDERAIREVQDAYQRPIEDSNIADLYRDEQHFDYQSSDSAPAA